MVDDLPAVSFRKSAVGGDVSEPRVSPANALALRRRVILLIHGFNVDEEHGRQTYERFVARLREMLVVQRDGPIAGDRLVGVYWPGDADWSFAKPLAYMRSVPRARDIGARLARLLDDAAAANGLVEVDIVAHSLGCRLALETLLAVHGNPQSRAHIRRIQLMAAAVPTFMLFDPDDTPRLRDAFEQSLEIGAKSLYSAADGVLSFAFPPGQTFAGDGEGFLPTAVGHARFPARSELARMDPIEMPDAGHGSYWGGDYPDESATAAYIAHEFLQIPDAAIRAQTERAIVDRTLPTRE
jgi:pimeloyl-ACP methyl ester carboxylesterase